MLEAIKERVNRDLYDFLRKTNYRVQDSNYVGLSYLLSIKNNYDIGDSYIKYIIKTQFKDILEIDKDGYIQFKEVKISNEYFQKKSKNRKDISQKNRNSAYGNNSLMNAIKTVFIKYISELNELEVVNVFNNYKYIESQKAIYVYNEILKNFPNKILCEIMDLADKNYGTNIPFENIYNKVLEENIEDCKKETIKLLTNLTEFEINKYVHKGLYIDEDEGINKLRIMLSAFVNQNINISFLYYIIDQLFQKKLIDFIEDTHFTKALILTNNFIEEKEADEIIEYIAREYQDEYIDYDNTNYVSYKVIRYLLVLSQEFNKEIPLQEIYHEINELKIINFYYDIERIKQPIYDLTKNYSITLEIIRFVKYLYRMTYPNKELDYINKREEILNKMLERNILKESIKENANKSIIQKIIDIDDMYSESYYKIVEEELKSTFNTDLNNFSSINKSLPSNLWNVYNINLFGSHEKLESLIFYVGSIDGYMYRNDKANPKLKKYLDEMGFYDGSFETYNNIEVKHRIFFDKRKGWNYLGMKRFLEENGATIYQSDLRDSRSFFDISIPLEKYKELYNCEETIINQWNTTNGNTLSQIFIELKKDKHKEFMIFQRFVPISDDFT